MSILEKPYVGLTSLVTRNVVFGVVFGTLVIRDAALTSLETRNVVFDTLVTRDADLSSL